MSIEGLSDLKELLSARGFKYNDLADIFRDDNYFHWEKDSQRKTTILKISASLFDDENRLKFIKKSDWKNEYVIYSENDKQQDDDLPF